MPPDCECCEVVGDLNKGKKLVREMFVAEREFGLCDYPSKTLCDVWENKEKEVRAWAGEK